MKVVEIISPVTINAIEYKIGKQLNVCDDLFIDLVEVQMVAILYMKPTPKKSKKGK